MLVDLSLLPISGKKLETLLGEANITLNKNTVPNETRKPTVTSGVRIGTPAVTTRGMDETDMAEIADMIADVIFTGADAVPGVKERACALCARYPLYEE